MKRLRFAVVGAGFWARYQLSAWKELPGVECVAIVDRVRAKAEVLAHDFDVRSVYDDPAECLRREQVDFIDVITSVDIHSQLVHLAAAHKMPVICQKPMGRSLQEAEKMVVACRETGTPFFVHENWRWQTPLREVKRLLLSGKIGRPFRARIDMISGFSVFRNQPSLKSEERFIIADLGSHILDVARFLFGEAETVYCQTERIHSDIKGEDVATIMMRMVEGTVVLSEMAYAGNPIERECFPETLLFVEADKGTLELGENFSIRLTTSEGTLSKRYPPKHYPWALPDYLVVQSSIVPCHNNILQSLRGEGEAETTADDNLKTVRLIDAAYTSAEKGEVIHLL